MQNLFTPQSTVPQATEEQVPAYLLAADNHNIGNQNSSWFEPSTWGDKAGNALKFGAVSMISGASQLYNSGVAIGKIAGIGGEEADTKALASYIDSNLGDYYSQNRQAADLWGFVASSLAPGLGGVKILNAGQRALTAATETGMVGRNIAQSVGLLVPKTETYILGAAQDINAASATFSALTQNGVKALMTGARQQVLEGIAFETAVQATMFSSPILREQDVGDITHNILVAGVLGGVVGGALVGAGTYKSIMSKVSDFEIGSKFSTARVAQQELNNSSINVLRNKFDLETAALPIKPAADATAEELALYTTQLNNVTQRAIRTENDIRLNINELGKGANNTVTNMVADVVKGLNATETTEVMLHANEITRISTITEVEKQINLLVKQGKPVPPELQVSYVKLTGEGAGRVVEGEPLVRSLADSVGIDKGKSIAEMVMDKVNSFKFKAGKLWDASTLTGATSHLEAEARYIWASKLEKLPDELAVHKNDIPLLEKARELGKLDVKLVDDTGQVIQNGFNSDQELVKYLIQTKEEVANTLMLKRAFEKGESDLITSEAAAKIVNTKQARLDGTAIGQDSADYFAYQSASLDYQKFLESRQVTAHAGTDTRFLPTYAKISRVAKDMSDADGHLLDAATWIKTQERISQQTVDNVLAKNLGALYELVPEITEQQVWTATRQGAGAKMAGFASGNYGSFQSVVNAYGQVTNKLKTVFRKTTSDTLEGPLVALGKNQEAAIEFSTVNQKVTRSAKQWVRHTDVDGSDYLITREAKKALEKDAEGALSIDELDHIPLVNQETIDTIDAMMTLSSQRTSTYGELWAAFGKTSNKDPSVYRPIRPDPKDYPYYAFVKDDKVTGEGHTTMIFANTKVKLQELVTKTEQAGYRVHVADDIKGIKEAYGDYEYERTLNEMYIDSDLKNKGVFSEFYTQTDPQKIVSGILQQHLRESDVMAMELMRAKNQKIFGFLEDQGKAYSRIESSKFGGISTRLLEKTGKNPYLDYIKTALDISKAPETGLLYSANKMLDESVSKAVGAIKDVWSATRTPYDAEKINSVLQRYGMDTGYRDAALDLLANHSAPRGELTKFVRAANGILANLTLGLDPLNSLVNAIGSNVLRGTETQHLVKAIEGGNTEIAGKLAQLAKIELPTGDSILSPAKLIYNAQRNFFGAEKDALMTRYKEAEYIVGDVSKFHNIVDEFALRGTETVSGLQGKLGKAFELAKDITEKGRVITGNKFAEDYNRFISADIARQLTDLGEQYGLLTRAESHTYINTFVNRVEGNIVASQRPLMFQGPLGNAIGLFQSYQFNMMQNLFRYVAEGSKKDMAMLLGLQGTFFGANGLPGFQFVNQHIIGTASGNKNHVDAYDAIYGAAGKQMGDLFVYGLPSDILRTNIYSRGDINPRQLTIIPTAPMDIPFVGAFGKMLGTVKDSVSRVANGGRVWETFLQGLEHNGISRPLAGMAQVLQATGPGGRPYSTTSQGSILFSNDLASIATLSRLAGGRPMDEAIVNDAVFRIQSYQQYDRAKTKLLAEAVKTASIEGNVPTDQEMVTFASKYAEYGGKQKNFNKWVLNEMKSANTSRAEEIVSQLQNPFAKKVQVLMGGTDE